jgi:hypothetical protein
MGNDRAAQTPGSSRRGVLKNIMTLGRRPRRACYSYPGLLVGHQQQRRVRAVLLDAARPAGLSPAVVQGELRGRLGYRGVIATDALEAGALSTGGQCPSGRGRSVHLCPFRRGPFDIRE